MRALHHTPDSQAPTVWAAEGETRRPSVDARRGGECHVTGATKCDSRRTMCARISPYARSSPASEHGDRRGEELVSQAGTPAGAAKSVRLALRRSQTWRK